MGIDYERFFLDNLALLNDAVATVARRQQLSTDEADDLAGAVRLKLIEDDYGLLRRFQGRSHLRTYLLVIIQRHLLDARTAAWGKWRPCRAAMRGGSTAILLDRLLTRDRLTFNDAYEVLRMHHAVKESKAELYRLSLAFRPRLGRRFVDAVSLEAMPADDQLDELDVNCRRIVARALTSALRRLPVEDRRLLKMRFIEGRTIADIARLLRLEHKPLYRRFTGLLTGLRTDLEQNNVTRDEARAVVDKRWSGMRAINGLPAPGRTARL